MLYLRHTFEIQLCKIQANHFCSNQSIWTHDELLCFSIVENLKIFEKKNSKVTKFGHQFSFTTDSGKGGAPGFNYSLILI